MVIGRQVWNLAGYVASLLPTQAGVLGEGRIKRGANRGTHGPCATPSATSPPTPGLAENSHKQEIQSCWLEKFVATLPP